MPKTANLEINTTDPAAVAGTTYYTTVATFKADGADYKLTYTTTVPEEADGLQDIFA